MYLPEHEFPIGFIITQCFDVIKSVYSVVWGSISERENGQHVHPYNWCRHVNQQPPISCLFTFILARTNAGVTTSDIIV